MALFRKHIDFARLVAVVMAGRFLSACMTWETQRLEPEQFRAADSTQTLRLTFTSGDTIMVHAPVITGDSLVGMQMRPDSLDHRVSIPLSAISQAEVGKGSQAVVVVGMVALLALAVAISSSSCCVGR